jgi:putative transposase
MKYPFIDRQRGQHTVCMLCRVLDVAPSGYYAWRQREGSLRSRENERLLAEIKVIHGKSRSSYGSPRIYHKLREGGRACSENRIAKIMRDNGIRAKTKRKFRVTTDSNHTSPVAENLLERQFEPKRPNAVWTSDITYVWTHEGWMFLAVVLDLFSRRIVGWAMEKRIKRELVMKALEMAIGRRRPAPGLMHHSDRGSQYASQDYQGLLKRHGLIPSMSRKGNCWDNAPTESFFSTLKLERKCI